MKKEELMHIGAVAKSTGLSVRQIRHWSDKGYVTPSISQCGDICYRLYGGEDVNRLERIKAYLDEGYTLKASVEKVRKEDGNDEK